jgi:Zn-dependent peptidase ImmA (M78 family)/DNA-binding XRE family transcriptional regulator
MAGVSALARAHLFHPAAQHGGVMTSPLDKLSPHEVGERLRTARDAAKLKQQQAADAIGIARTTLVAIEQGQRKVKLEELRALARLYRTSVNALLRLEAVHADLMPRFRKLASSYPDAVDEAARLLNDLARAEVELENLLGVQRTRNYPPERPILPGDVRLQAEQDALELRQRLGLGMAPIHDVVSVIELQLGVRVFVRRLSGSEISGLFAFDDATGACILLNASHPRDRRDLTACHEVAHLVTRQPAEVLDKKTSEDSREERYAHAFARSFMMPARTVMEQFKEVTAGSKNLSRRHVILLGHVFGVSREALVRRLEELKLVKPGAWDWFVENGGITDEQEREVLGERLRPDRQREESREPTTLRLALLAAAAWRQGLLTEGQLAEMLKIDRVELRRLIQEGEAGGSDGDDAPELLA